MRSIIEFQIFGSNAGPDAVKTSLNESGWTHADLGLSREQFVELARQVIENAEKQKRDLPISPDSKFIQDAITSSCQDSSGRELFPHYSFERTALEQAVLILTQIPREDRPEAFQREMTILKSNSGDVYGVLFSAAASKSAVAGNPTLQARLRSSDLDKLQTATSSFVSALNPVKSTRVIRNYASPGGAVRNERRIDGLQTHFSRIEIRSVTNELLFIGEVIPIRGKASLIRYSMKEVSAKILIGISLFLILVSAVLYWLGPEAGWWAWFENLAGRLATGAFGALLVDGAIDYSALRKSLNIGSGPITAGALIRWRKGGK